MPCKAARLVLTGFMLLWFAVIVPGHQRGILRLPGGKALPSCCAKVGSMTVLRPGETSEPDSDRAPRPTRSNCAICQFTATLDAPGIPTFIVPDSQPLAIAAIERTGRTWTPPQRKTWHRRGPPANFS